MKVKYAIGLLVILGALGYMLFGGLGRNLVYFLTPSEYLEDQARYQNRPVRLGGLVEPGSVLYDKDTLTLEFVLTDGVAKVVVVHKGTPPALFKEGQGVVVEGRFQDGVFKGNNLLVKHSETYQPPKEGYTPEDVRKLIEEAR
ncbi:MAG: cytochrome c maturation protein CcmE [Thermaceae bacterium]